MVSVPSKILYWSSKFLSPKGRSPVRKNVFFRALPEKGGGGGLARICSPFLHHVVPYILTSISCYVILFGHFYRTHVHMGSDHWVAMYVTDLFETF